MHRVDNRKSTMFWKDLWLNIDGNLLAYKFPNVTVSQKEIMVKDMVFSHRCWNLEELRKVLPNKIMVKILVNSSPRPEDPPNTLAWRYSKDGQFSVKSAYKALSPNIVNHNYIWRRIWG
ncbi:hypothetical protein S245_005246 [Arachis hypogaea]